MTIIMKDRHIFAFVLCFATVADAARNQKPNDWLRNQGDLNIAFDVLIYLVMCVWFRFAFIPTKTTMLKCHLNEWLNGIFCFEISFFDSRLFDDNFCFGLILEMTHFRHILPVSLYTLFRSCWQSLFGNMLLLSLLLSSMFAVQKSSYVLPVYISLTLCLCHFFRFYLSPSLWKRKKKFNGTGCMLLTYLLHEASEANYEFMKILM